MATPGSTARTGAAWRTADWATVTAEVTDGVATLWLDRPDRGNAFTRAMQAELHEALAALDADDDVRAVVVTGRGRFFSTGADLEPGGAGFAMDDAAVAELRAQVAARPRPWRLRTPVLAAMNGAAVGLGLTLPLQWDIRVVAQDARYGFVFTRRGLIPEANSLWLLPRLIGASRATELLLTGRLFSGAEAAEMGLASRAVPAEDVLSTTLAIAHEIAGATAPLAVGLTKQLLYEMLEQPDREAAYSHEWDAFRWVGNTADTAEGVAAFLAKRPPRWTTDKASPLPESRGSWDAR